nr:type II secretion system protein GspM [Gluconacetobacter tumulisoli]
MAIAVTMAGLALLTSLVAPFVKLYRDDAATIADQRAMVAHVEALAARIPTLREQYAQALAIHRQGETTLSGRNDAEAGAELAQKLHALASTHRIVIASDETLPPARDGHFRRIGLRVALVGRWDDFVRFLDDFDHTTPHILVDELEIRPGHDATLSDPAERSGGTAAPTPLVISSTLTLVGFRPAPLSPDRPGHDSSTPS